MAVPQLVRTPDELKAARQTLGLSAEGLAMMVRTGDGRTVRRWESGENEIPGPVTVVLETAMGYLRERDDISRELEMLQSGRMHSSTKTFNGLEDTTAANIVRLSEAKRTLEQAFTILTRQPLSDNASSQQVHWYTLKRLNPTFDPDQKDVWTLPGETSPEAALAYFVKDARFPHRLQLCDGDDALAEFLLEKRNVLRTLSGASQRLRPGDQIEALYAKRLVVKVGKA
jgi:hypothetical protein